MRRCLLFFILIGNIGLAQSFCNLNLGADTSLCFPATVLLDAGPGFNTYNWNTGATTQTITVTQPGTFSVSVYAIGNEAVNNGSFTNGNTGFTSGYTYATYLWPESTFWVGPNANTVHPNFVGTALSPPNFMVVNGSSNPALNVWCQTIINIVPNTTYQFSTWVCSVAPGNPAILQFRVNGTALSAAFTAPAATNSWVQYTATWFSGTNTTANICIQNQNTATGGNDFGLDDISFKPVCNKSDTIVVAGSPQISINLQMPDSICQQDLFTATATPTGGFWGGDFLLDSAAGTFDYSTPGIYMYYYVVDGPCGDADTGYIYIAEYPQPNLGSDFELCPGDIAELQVNSTAEFTFWSTGATGQSIMVSDTGTYWVRQLNEPGCEAYDTIQVLWRCPMDPVLQVPNVFTPNNDDINDYLTLEHQYIGTFEMLIYNRWGALVYKSTDVAQPWDGQTLQGKPAAGGVYFYHIKYEGAEVKGPKELSGNITLMR